MHYFEQRLGIEWDILEFFHRFHCKFMDILNFLISYLGAGEIMMVLMIVVYFAIDKRIGKKIAFACSTSTVLINGCVKTIFNAARPFQFEGREHLRKLSEAKDGATGSSFPSGHSCNTGTLYGTICFNAKQMWIKIVCICLMVLVPISRLYLGVHFPGDVVIGLILGLVLAAACGLLYDKLSNTKWFYIACGIIAVCVIPFIVLNWNTPNTKDLFNCYGLFLGIVLSFFIEEKWINFTMDVVWWKKLLRVVAGGVVAVAFKEGLKLIMPDHNAFQFLRYFLLTVAGVGIVPFFFTKENKKEAKANE